mgnify:CR=1 FL=1
MRTEVNLANLTRGALMEQFNTELEKVIENIADPNTEAKKARKITINITLKPNENRNIVAVEVQTKSTLAPANKVETNLFIDKDKDGNLAVAEIYNEIPGQMSIDDLGIEPQDKNSKVINIK